MIRELFASILEWFRKLVSSKATNESPKPTPLKPAEVQTLVAKPIDYSAYLIDYRTGLKHTPYTLQMVYQPLPQGWSWQEWAKVAGAVDPTTHDNRDQKIEEHEARKYVSEASLDIMGFREALLTVPGKLKVTSGRAVILSYDHGIQSKGAVWATINGANRGNGPDWTLGPGDYSIDFTGEAPAVRIAVKIRPAL